MKTLIELKDTQAYKETKGAIKNYNNLKGKTISSVEMDEDGSFFRVHFTSGDWADFSSSIDDACGNKAVVRSSLVFVSANVKVANRGHL